MTKMTALDKGSLIGTNPYNKNKTWDDEGKTGEAFVSADDSMAYVSRPKTVIMDKMEDTKPAVQPSGDEPEDSRFSKVDYKKRYDDLKGHYDKQVNSFRTQEKELRKQLNDNAPVYEPPSTPEELAKFREENPSIYNVVETVAHMEAGKKVTDLQAKLDAVTETLALSQAREAYAELKVLVPDFEQIRGDDNFHNWVEQQPQQIQDWVYKNSTDVQMAAQAINLYKASIGMQQPNESQPPQFNTQQGADQAVSVRNGREEPTSREKVWSRSEIASLSPAQYEQHREAIDAAFADGRISQG